VIDNISVRVTRVLHTVLVERESIPFDAVMVGDDELEIDLVEARQQGQEGEFRRRWQIVYEDGVENQHTLTDAWVAAQPVTDITAYGRKLVSRPVPGVEGKTYWRRIRMYATSYSKSTAGVSPTVSYYGITRMGLRMTKGIVAVDPSVVSLGTRVYVPGYGLGLAADTGGGIRSKMIDLGFDDENLESWHQWVWVYLLDPAPARSTIRWVLPKWPPE
jgi:3D (Asp-Asp-Asp) domain-containing protein